MLKFYFIVKAKHSSAKLEVEEAKEAFIIVRSGPLFLMRNQPLLWEKGSNHEAFVLLGIKNEMRCKFCRFRIEKKKESNWPVGP